MIFDNDQAFTHQEKIAEALLNKTYYAGPFTLQDNGTIEK